MIWSLIKVLLFVGVAAGLAYGASLIVETPGEVRLAFAGQEMSLSPLGFIVVLLVLFLAVWVLLRLVGLLVAVMRFMTGDATAITRYLDRNRERKGFDALSEALIALAAGEGRKAQAKIGQAEKLLSRPDVTRLIAAQTAEQLGNTDRALEYYKQMLSDDSTRFVGVQGLLRQKLAEGDTATAMKLAQKAFALKPKHEGTLDTLFALQAKAEDWSGARKTLAAKVRAAALPRDVGKRREAVLSLADAGAAFSEGKKDKARDAAYAANKLAPHFVPAAALAARLHAENGEARQAARIIKKAWAESPHPDLASAFAAIAPEESPEARLKRFQPLLKMKPSHPETRLVTAELSLTAEDFPGARRALGDLAETHPTTRSLALMAAIERGEGAADSVVRGWLAKALEAPRGEAWVCEACNTAHGQWAPLCESCNSFDTLSWTTPAQTEDAASGSAMLPLIVGALQAPDREPEPEEPETAAEPEPEAPEPEEAAAPRPETQGEGRRSRDVTPPPADYVDVGAEDSDVDVGKKKGGDQVAAEDSSSARAL